MADDDSDKDYSPVGQGSLSFTAKCLYNNILPHVWNSQFEHVNKLHAQNFEGLIFKVEVKSAKIVEIIVIKTFLLYH